MQTRNTCILEDRHATCIRMGIEKNRLRYTFTGLFFNICSAKNSPHIGNWCRAFEIKGANFDQIKVKIDSSEKNITKVAKWFSGWMFTTSHILLGRIAPCLLHPNYTLLYEYHQERVVRTPHHRTLRMCIQNIIVKVTFWGSGWCFGNFTFGHRSSRACASGGSGMVHIICLSTYYKREKRKHLHENPIYC